MGGWIGKRKKKGGGRLREIEREEMGKGGRRDGRDGEEGLVVVNGVFVRI